MDPAIEIKNLSVTLDGQQILKDISVSLPAGHIIGLIGPSGAGKTTLIRTIVGRLRVDRGKVKVLGLPAGSPRLRDEVGYMTQSISVYQDLTISENLRYFATITGCLKEEAQEVIKKVDLSDHSHKLVRKLSGGQKSRVSLAVALLGHPRLLLLDEPTVGVDPVLRHQLWQLFKKLADRGTTVLVTSHVMDEASHCQDLFLIRDGELLAYGTPAELCKRTGTKTVEESFLKLVGEKK